MCFSPTRIVVIVEAVELLTRVFDMTLADMGLVFGCKKGSVNGRKGEVGVGGSKGDDDDT